MQGISSQTESYSRRNFIKASALFSFGLAFGGLTFADTNAIRLPQRKLGTQGLSVSALGLGCMGMSHGYGKKDKKEMIKVLHKAVDLGITLFDTAEYYGPHTNEELLGEALSSYKDKITIATKFGLYFNNGTFSTNSSKENIKRAVEGSLKRLKRDCIDLYYQHRVDPKVPIEEVAETIKQLIKEGKVKYWGLSEANAQTLQRAHKVLPLSALESEYSMQHRNVESHILPALEKLKIGLVAFGPLGRGFLSGNFGKDTKLAKDDSRNYSTRFSQEAIEANGVLVDLIQEIAKSKGNATTPAQIALAWLLAQKSYIVPIFGTTNANRLQENLGALSVHLDKDELAQINAQLQQIKIIGERYPQSIESLSEQ